MIYYTTKKTRENIHFTLLPMSLQNVSTFVLFKV